MASAPDGLVDAEAWCSICEKVSELDICEECEQVCIPSDPVLPPPRNMDETYPDVQLSAATIPLKQRETEVHAIEAYALKVMRGEFNTPFPLHELELTQEIPVVQQFIPDLIDTFLEPHLFLTYGKRIRNVDCIDDFESPKTLLVVDPEIPPTHHDWDGIFSRTHKTYILFLNIEKALFQKPVNMREMYLVSEETREFRTMKEPIQCYHAGDIVAFFRAAWRLGYSPIRVSMHTQNIFQDFLVYQVRPGTPQALEFGLQLYDAPILDSHHLNQVVYPYAHEGPVSICGKAALYPTEGGGEPAYAVSNEICFIPNRAHQAHIPTPEVYNRMSPTERASLGRVLVGHVQNIPMVPPAGYPVLPMVVVDGGAPTIVKFETPTHTTVFEPNEEGPLLFYGPTEEKGTSMRASVAYITVENARVKNVGTVTDVLYLEKDFAPYLGSPRVIEHYGGTLIKKVLTHDELIENDRDKRIDRFTLILYQYVNAHFEHSETSRTGWLFHSNKTKEVVTYRADFFELQAQISDHPGLSEALQVSDAVYVPCVVSIRNSFGFTTLAAEEAGEGSDSSLSSDESL